MNARDRGGGFDKSSGFCSHMPLALQSVSKGQAFLPALLRRLAFFRLGGQTIWSGIEVVITALTRKQIP
jgi:hypothetical protein